MFKFSDIVKENDATFYDYRTGTHKTTLPRLAITSVCSLALATLFTGDITAFVGSLITVQAVLVGFAFSVIFFILSTPPAETLNRDSIEDRHAVRRAEKLANELFSNVSYFTLVGMAALASSIALLAPDLPTFLARALAKARFEMSLAPALVASSVGRFILLFTTALLTIESAYTFARTVGRVWFLFSERARLSGRYPSRT